MEGIELLENLKKDFETFKERANKQDQLVGEALTQMLVNIMGEGPLEILPLRADVREPWCLRDEKSRFQINTTVRFKNPDGSTYTDGSPKALFGADISLYIFDTYLKMNYGTCGEYGHDDVEQIEKAKLVVKIWEHEDMICSLLNDMIDMDVIKQLNETRRQIDRINDAIQADKRAQERSEWLGKIRQASYIAYRRKEQKGHYEEGKGWIKEGYEYKYTSHEKILKITDKTILTQDRYADKHRRPIDQVISYLKYSGYVLLDEMIFSSPIEEEGETPTEE